MISFHPFFKTIKKRNISTYQLVIKYGFSRSLLDRLKHNKPLSTVTINDICTLLNCKISDIVVYLPDNDEKKLK